MFLVQLFVCALPMFALAADEKLVVYLMGSVGYDGNENPLPPGHVVYCSSFEECVAGGGLPSSNWGACQIGVFSNCAFTHSMILALEAQRTEFYAALFENQDASEKDILLQFRDRFDNSEPHKAVMYAPGLQTFAKSPLSQDALNITENLTNIDTLRSLARRGFGMAVVSKPTTMLENPDLNIISFNSDEAMGGALVVEEFCRIAGEKPIRVLAYGCGRCQWSVERIINFRKQIAKCPTPHQLVSVFEDMSTNYWGDIDGTRARFQEWFATELLEDRKVNGLFVANSMMGGWAIETLKETKLRSLGQFFLNGYDDNLMSREYTRAGFMFADVNQQWSIPDDGITKAALDTIMFTNFSDVPERILNASGVVAPVDIRIPEMSERVRARIQESYVRGARPITYTDLPDVEFSVWHSQALVAKSPLQVDVNFELRGVSDVDVKGGSLSTYYYLDLTWNDPRLRYSEYQLDGGLSWQDATILWLPVWTIENLEVIPFTGEQTGRKYATSGNNGDVFWRRQEHTITTCSMSVSKFPFDSHTCNIDVQSVNDAKSVVFNVGTLNSDGLDGMEWGLDITMESLCFSSSQAPVLQSNCLGDQHSGVRISFHLRRNASQYHITHIGPCILLTILCMCCHFLNDVSTRMTIITVTTLAIIQLRGEDVQMSAMTWLDEFLLVHICINFVVAFATIFVYSQSFLWKFMCNRPQKPQLGVTQNPVVETAGVTDDGDEIDTGGRTALIGKLRAVKGDVHAVDAIARVAWPFVYAILLSVSIARAF
eukprot:COSAG02_NODE_1594_length_11776_cov_5.586366_1_plen_771_part_00